MVLITQSALQKLLKFVWLHITPFPIPLFGLVLRTIDARNASKCTTMINQGLASYSTSVVSARITTRVQVREVF